MDNFFLLLLLRLFMLQGLVIAVNVTDGWTVGIKSRGKRKPSGKERSVRRRRARAVFIIGLHHAEEKMEGDVETIYACPLSRCYANEQSTSFSLSLSLSLPWLVSFYPLLQPKQLKHVPCCVAVASHWRRKTIKQRPATY